MPLSNTNCIGYPYCDERVESPDIACRNCWFKLPYRIRNFLKALIYKGASEETGHRLLSEARDFLHPKLRFSLVKKANKANYTVVPYKGRRGARKRPKPSRQTKLKQKYYGGPWEYQKK